MQLRSDIDLSGPSLLEIYALEAFQASDADLFNELWDLCVKEMVHEVVDAGDNEQGIFLAH